MKIYLVDVYKRQVSEYRIRRDAYAFLEHLESLTEDEDNHFSRADAVSYTHLDVYKRQGQM